MLHNIALLSTVTVLAVLEQAYFAVQVITFRRKFKISPPITSGPPEFERIFRAHISSTPSNCDCLNFLPQIGSVFQNGFLGLKLFSYGRKTRAAFCLCFFLNFSFGANCSEYFPIFLSLLWVAGVFSHQVLAAFCGVIYLYARYQYFRGYMHSAERRLGPMYFSTGVLCILIGLSMVGLLVHFVRYF